MRHVFSAELDEGKRNYLLQSFEDVEHLYADVACFTIGEGYCYRCNETHKISKEMHAVDLHFVGPSCKDVSPSSVSNTFLCFVCWGSKCVTIAFDLIHLMLGGRIYIYILYATKFPYVCDAQRLAL